MTRRVVGGLDNVHLEPRAPETPAGEAARLLAALERELGGSVRACRAHGAAWSPQQQGAIFENIATRLRQAAGGRTWRGGRAMLGVHDDDDDLPPEHLTFGELLGWLAARLGRKPTLEDVAALRWAQEQRSIRKARRARLAATRYRWPREGRDVPSARAMVKDILGGPEMVAFWAAAGWLLNSLPGFIAANRAHDEWITRPSTVLRLAEAAAALPAGAVFAPSPRAEAEALLTYLDWKLTGAPVLESGFVPGEVAALDRRLAATANAVSPDVAQRIRVALADAHDDGARRALLREYRQVGEGAVQQWPGVDRREPGAPLGLLVEPEPEPEAAAPGDADGPPAGPRPPCGGRR